MSTTHILLISLELLTGETAIAGVILSVVLVSIMWIVFKFYTSLAMSSKLSLQYLVK
jgi:hypothetical protein